MKKLISTKMKIFMLSLASISIGCYIAAAVVLYNSDFKLANYVNDWHSNNYWNIGWNNNSLNGNIEKEFSSSVKNISIKSYSANIDLNYHESDNVKILVRGNFYNNYSFNDGLKKYDLNGDTLNIETNEGNTCSNLNISIYIPASYANNISIDSNSGDIKLSNLSSSNLNLSSLSGELDLNNVTSNKAHISSTSGDISISKCTVNDTNISSSSGEIQLDGSLGNLNVSSTSGNIYNSPDTLGSNTSLSSLSGEVELKLNNNNDYELQFKSTSGDLNSFNSDNFKTSKHNYTVTKGNGTNKINVNTTSGDLYLN